MTVEQPSEVAAIPEEERARAYAYALLGRLLYAAPDESLLAEIRAQDAGASAATGGTVERAWHHLIKAAGVAEARDLADEYEALFGGVGKALVTPYTSRYVADSAPDKHLVALRETLAQLGMMRRVTTFEVEDHVAAICDAMRLLIERNQPLDVQKAFFSRYVLPGALSLCDAINAVESARFYRSVAALFREFIELERTAFDMADA